MRAASEATESDLKKSIEAKVQEIQAQERYSLSNGTPESISTSNEKALDAVPQDLPIPPAPQYTMCTYCNRPRHDIRQCHVLQKDLRDGCVTEGTVLRANFMFKGGDSNRYQPYDRDSAREYHYNGGSTGRGRGGGRGGRGGRGSSKGGRGNKGGRGGYDQSCREEGHVAIVTTIKPAVSITAQVTDTFDPVWTIDSGCTRHVTHHLEWMMERRKGDGTITVGGKSEIPIEATGTVIQMLAAVNDTAQRAICTKAKVQPVLSPCCQRRLPFRIQA
ncbi:TPA: hypothetical protein N0F65_010633 [Lagenidium giganteum]|uniref:Retrovirus-related Pol polyprotein from transposon TNT 1-94-like beta-barrel domain-containing protein n=1 Tax=Lagenidium giganteum TaxID=4803 RepID=A0AAV2ZIP5_9STRA|nr:TPA: hypothetical protein N0F65_010633 [Lagenidium giganteum]